MLSLPRDSAYQSDRNDRVVPPQSVSAALSIEDDGVASPSMWILKKGSALGAAMTILLERLPQMAALYNTWASIVFHRSDTGACVTNVATLKIGGQVQFRLLSLENLSCYRCLHTSLYYRRPTLYLLNCRHIFVKRTILVPI